MEFGLENIDGLLEQVADYILDAAMDTLMVIPFLLATYLILEFIEHKMSDKSQDLIKKAGVAGPLFGALLGLIPQCGFSAAASSFYAGRVITLGTLMAVYLSTSDEMIPIFIAGGVPLEQMLLLLVSKFIIGICFGFAIDFTIRQLSKHNEKFRNRKFKIHEMCERDRCSCDHQHKKNIIIPALLHTLQISIFIFIISIILNALMDFMGGSSNLALFVESNKYASVFVCALIGLIPNCASSVVVSQLFANGIIGIGALMAGLLNSAGIGLLVLFRTNRPVKRSLFIAALLFCIGLIIGLIISIFA